MDSVYGNTEAIAILKASLTQFRSDMGEVLEAVAFKILQIQEWLEETHVGYVRQLEFCQEAILQAHAHDSPDDDAHSDAYDQLKGVQEQFDNFLSWKQKIEEAILEYQQQAVLMKAQLEDDVTKAKLFIEERISKLEEYFTVGPPLGRSSTVISIDSWGKTNDQTVPGNNQRVALENAEPTTQGNLVIEAGKYSDSELRAAQYMTTRSHQVILRQPTGTREGGGTSDLLVDGVRYDVYTPATDKPNRIISAIAKKNRQAEGIVLDLAQTKVTPAQLGNILSRVQGAGATNIKDIVIIGTENHAQH